WTLAQDLAFYKTAGINVANIPVFKFSKDIPAGIEDIKRSGVRAVCLSGTSTQLIGGSALEVLKPSIDAASALNSPSMYFVSGGCAERMTTDDAYAALVKALKPVTDYARTKDVRLALEHTSIATRSHGFIHTLADAAELSRDADIGIC